MVARDKLITHLYGTCLALVAVNGLIPLATLVETHAVRINTMVTCDNVRSQQHYSLSDMSGTWYGVEIIDHVAKSGSAANSCVKVRIRQRESNYIELEWREDEFAVTYEFVILDQNERGKWTSQGPQIVTGMPDGFEYQQFAGNVFITKASDSDLVLTFCSVPNKLYSLVMLKTRHINETQLATLHSLLHRFGMPKPVDIKRFCRNTASHSLESQIFLMFFTITTILFVRRLQTD